MGEKRCNDSERDESTGKRLQCKKQYFCTPHGRYTVSRFSFAMAMPVRRIHAQNPCMKPLKSLKRIMRLCDIRNHKPPVLLITGRQYPKAYHTLKADALYSIRYIPLSSIFVYEEPLRNSITTILKSYKIALTHTTNTLALSFSSSYTCLT